MKKIQLKRINQKQKNLDKSIFQNEKAYIKKPTQVETTATIKSHIKWQKKKIRQKLKSKKIRQFTKKYKKNT